MGITRFEEIIELREAGLLNKLTEVWNASVRASHHFLSERDIEKIKPFVKTALQDIQQLIVVWQSLEPLGFMGIEDDKIEMLFLSPTVMGKGIGSRLIDLAVSRYEVGKVDVNEQNKQAVRFYEHKGFRVFGRDETDAQGNPFPILHMAFIPPA